MKPGGRALNGNRNKAVRAYTAAGDYLLFCSAFCGLQYGQDKHGENEAENRGSADDIKNKLAV
jgi:heme/copper-type cytochrome/quinol oxidase subunit 2